MLWDGGWKPALLRAGWCRSRIFAGSPQAGFPRVTSSSSGSHLGFFPVGCRGWAVLLLPGQHKSPGGVCGPNTWPGGMGLRDPTVGPRQQVLGAALTPRRFPLNIFLIFATNGLENLGAGSFVAAEVLLASTRSPSFPVFTDLPSKPPCAGTLESRRASGHGPGPVCRWLCGVGQVPPADLWVCLGQELGAVMDGL